MSKKFILVVDDDPVVLKSLEDYLTSCGYKVMVEEDGYEVLLFCEDFLPDLIIADIRMPKLDGITLLEALKNKKETREVPVIFMTAYSDDDKMARALELGAHHFLIKPFPLESLRQTLDRIFTEEYTVG